MRKPLGLAFAALLAPTVTIAAPATTVVFFSEWSARIDEAARRAIDAAAERAKQDGAKELTVTGYADTTGSKEANALLSATRAQVVTDRSWPTACRPGKSSRPRRAPPTSSRPRWRAVAW